MSLCWPFILTPTISVGTLRPRQRYRTEASKTLIHIPHYDLNWQAVYRYAQPVFLPKGTVISMRYVYDNSDGNLANPNHPAKRVLAGNRASDEMAQLGFQVLPKSLPHSTHDPRLVLQEALAPPPPQPDVGGMLSGCAQAGTCDQVWQQMSLHTGNGRAQESLTLHPLATAKPVPEIHLGPNPELHDCARRLPI